MRFTAAVDTFVAEMWADGRFTSELTERSYRGTLSLHAEDVGNRDPSKVGREDVKRTLGRWSYPNTRRIHRGHLVSFYDWAMEEGHRKDNPARQTRKSRNRKTTVYRLTRDEVRQLRAAARPGREQRIVDIGLLAGLRAQELIGLQGRHLERGGWIWVSEDIGKGRRERWVPVLPELEPTVAECVEGVASDEFVLPHRASQIHGRERRDIWDPTRPMAYESLHRCVVGIGKRAGISARVTPHLLRHAYGDHIARFAGIKVAQFVLGHASVGTTERYTGQPTLDEVAIALSEFGFGESRLPADDRAVRPLVGADGRLRMEVTVSDQQRVFDLGDFPQLLLWLRTNPAFIHAVKAMGEEASRA